MPRSLLLALLFSAAAAFALATSLASLQQCTAEGVLSAPSELHGDATQDSELIPKEQRHLWPRGSPRPPGTLLLNMLIKNEREHLDRTLPRWAAIIDYWIIGVDDANTDDSSEVIQKHLGHIPGQIVVVHFDGMGPTWSILVKEGLRLYPQATHGIIADADFAPRRSVMNKMDLDLRCSKHMFTIWTQDGRNERKMDWIYRNIEGATVKRRTHQILEVPVLPRQEVFQTLVDLPVEEREGGYQDRSGKKAQKYIEFLEADLLDYPNDTRTLYYLGYAHFDLFSPHKDNPKPEHWAALDKAISYFEQRAAIPSGNAEERWFALLKLAEIFERFKREWSRAEVYYTNCTTLDAERADAWFYLGQHYRLSGEFARGLPYLKRAASLPVPQRSLFQWHHLYWCLSKLEYARCLNGLTEADSVSRREYKQAVALIAQADCSQGDANAAQELKSLQAVFQTKSLSSKASKAGGGGATAQRKLVVKLLKFLTQQAGEIEQHLLLLGDDDSNDDDDEDDDESESDSDDESSQLASNVARMQSYVDSLQGKSAADSSSSSACREFRLATTPYLELMQRESMQQMLTTHAPNNALHRKWDKLNKQLHVMCR